MTSTFKTPTDIRFDKFEEFFKEHNRILFNISRNLPSSVNSESINIQFVQDAARLNAEWQANSDFYYLMDVEGNGEEMTKQQAIDALKPLLEEKLLKVAVLKLSEDRLIAYLAEVEDNYLRAIEDFIIRN